MGLRTFLRDWNHFATKQKLDMSYNTFAELKLDLECFVRKEERRGIGFRKFLSKKAKRNKGVGLETVCPSKKGGGE